MVGTDYLECTVCSKRVSVSEVVKCPGCRALYFCSEEHCRVCTKKLGHDEEECQRMRRQREDGQAIGGLFEGAWPWRDYASGESTLVGAFEAAGGDGGCTLRRSEREGFPLVCSFDVERGFSSSVCAEADATSNGWTEFYASRSIRAESHAGLALHTSLTIVSVLKEALCFDSLMAGTMEAIRIHLLGVDEELTFLACLAELSEWFPGKRVELVCMGPRVPEDLHGKAMLLQRNDVGGRSIEYRLHFDAEEGTSNTPHSVSAKCLRAPAYDRALLEAVGSPHVIFAQNSGLAAYTSWLPTIQLILELSGVPFFTTDYCEEAALRGAQVLQALGARPSMLLSVKPNRFRQPLRKVNADNDLPSWSNGFWFGLKPRA